MILDTHHIIEEVAFLLVISMWGNTGTEWQYIGNQVVLRQPMTEEQCLYLLQDQMWEHFYVNEYYKVMIHCVPEKQYE